MLNCLRSVVSAMVVLCFCGPLRADEMPAARARWDRLAMIMGQIRQDLPAITRAADAAARPFVAGRSVGVRGEPGLAREMSHRAGALMAFDGGPGGSDGGVVLYAFGLSLRGQDDAARLDEQIADARALVTGGSVVIAIASTDHLRRINRLDEARAASTMLLDNHVPADQPLLEPAANAVVAWTWCAELFGACTRLHQVPVVCLERGIDRRHRWHRTYQSRRFHDDMQVQPIAAGWLGGEYLHELRRVLRDVGTAGWGAMSATAQRAGGTIVDGGRVFLRCGGSYLGHHTGGKLPADPNLFTPLDHDGSDPALPSPGAADFVIAVGQMEEPGAGEWGEPQMLRQAGRGVAWIVGGYQWKPRQLKEGEIVVDQYWPVGDALVKIPNYPVRLAPASGVVSQAVFWALCVEVHAIVEDHRAHSKRPLPAPAEPAAPNLPWPQPETRDNLAAVDPM